VINLTEQQILELPVDELALAVLADLKETKEWNEYNYGLLFDQQGEYSNRIAVARAISEATGWLRSRGLLARTPNQSAPEAIFVTRAGDDALVSGIEGVRARERLQTNLHPLLQQKVRRQFMLGEYETAIFVAMKAIEIRVRKLGGLGDEVTGVNLMTAAFKAGGPLADSAAVPAEAEGTMALFRGAFAVLRNPSGHREVHFDDVTEAAEAVMTASLLMRILDRVELRLVARTETQS
jgi:uncharacterized protein (TIGR02391 family)